MWGLVAHCQSVHDRCPGIVPNLYLGFMRPGICTKVTDDARTDGWVPLSVRAMSEIMPFFLVSSWRLVRVPYSYSHVPIVP